MFIFADQNLNVQVLTDLFTEMDGNGDGIIQKDEFTITRNDRLNTKTPQGNLKEIQVTVSLKETPKNFRPGGTVRAHIETVLAKDVVIAPLSGIVARDKSYSVTTAQGQRRDVTLGKASNTHAEILDGLKVGERVRLTHSK